MPPPAHLPSLRSEHSVAEPSVAIVPSGSSGNQLPFCCSLCWTFWTVPAFRFWFLHFYHKIRTVYQRSENRVVEICLEIFSLCFVFVYFFSQLNWILPVRCFTLAYWFVSVMFILLVNALHLPNWGCGFAVVRSKIADWLSVEYCKSLCSSSY